VKEAAVHRSVSKLTQCAAIGIGQDGLTAKSAAMLRSRVVISSRASPHDMR
jgi:hypothetical protein